MMHLLCQHSPIHLPCSRLPPPLKIMSESGAAPDKSVQVKLVLLGEAAVGKSSVVLRFVRLGVLLYLVHKAHAQIRFRCQMNSKQTRSLQLALLFSLRNVV